MSNAFDLFFGGLEVSEVNIQHINEAAKAYFQDCLNQALELRLLLPSDQTIDLDFEASGSRERVAEIQKMLQSRKYDETIKSETQVLFKRVGKGAGHLDLELVEHAYQVIARAQLHKHRFLTEELLGGVYDGAPDDPLFRNILPTDLPPLSGEAGPSITFGAAVERFLDMRAGSWTGKTLADNQRTLNLAVELIGAERPLTSLATGDVKEFRDTLAGMPRNALRAKANGNRTITDVISEGASNAHLTAKTQRKYLSMFRGFLNWAIAEELMDKMPGPTIRVLGKTEAPQHERDPYPIEKLKRIFSSPVYRGCQSPLRRSAVGKAIIRDAYYWIPLIALFSGMRAGEIAQLLISDVKEEGGVWYFDIAATDGTGQRLKTKTSVRRVPLHPVLVELGFLQNIQGRAGKSAERLFAEIELGRTGQNSHSFSKWWGRYARKIGVHSPKHVFHSFRHNFTDALREADVPEQIAKRLLGHSHGDAHSRDGSGVGLAKLNDAVGRVQYNFDIVACIRSE